MYLCKQGVHHHLVLCIDRIWGPSDFCGFEAVLFNAAFPYIIRTLTAVFSINLIYVYTYSYILKSKQIKTSMFIWENNPLTFKFLVTSFGIAVSLYTSFFSEIGSYTFKHILNIAAFFLAFVFYLFFCFLFFKISSIVESSFTV